MKALILILLISIALQSQKVKAQVQPTFNLMVKNFVLGDTLGGSGNVLFFDITFII